MTISFKAAPAAKTKDTVVATALTGVVYTENKRLHVKCNDRHFIYKFDGSPVGWYARNLKTSDDIYLGENACPTAELESLEVKDKTYWPMIIDEDKEPVDEEPVEKE